MAIIRSIVVASIVTNAAARCVRKFVLCRSMRSSSVVLLDALAPDQIAIALATMGQLEEESRQLESAMDTATRARPLRGRTGATPV